MSATLLPRTRTIVVLLAAMMLSVAERELTAAPGRSAHALLDVPYVSQTPELCGGAAVAMVLRYWGERDVFPQDFAPLVASNGIVSDVLASAVRARGWQAIVFSVADKDARARIGQESDRGRPLIALIEVAPRTYHYVVIVGSTLEDVVVHDPARAPFRVMRWAAFDRAWKATGRLTMLVLPPEGFSAFDAEAGAGAARTATRSTESESQSGQPGCALLVDRAVQLALDGEREEAELALTAATSLCPRDAAAWRELAGLRFSQSRWSEAQEMASVAVRLEPDDAYASQLLATSRYLLGDSTGALEAWNRAGEPRIDAIDIHGAARTRQPVIQWAAGLEPRGVLTGDAFLRASRRLRDLPVATDARLKYQPAFSEDGRGLANVDMFIDERRPLPSGWLPLAAIGARALVMDEVQADVAGLLGAGERLSTAWRWSPGRPRVAIGVALPSARGIRGVVSADWSWERQLYAQSIDGRSLAREEHRSAGLHLSDWAAGWLRWKTGVLVDRFTTAEDRDADRDALTFRHYIAADGSLDARLARDRLALTASGGFWQPIADGDRFAAGQLLAAWRSSTHLNRPFWSASTAFDVAGRAAPFALWPGAGTRGRSGLLRAHPLLQSLEPGDVVIGPVFGRHVARGSLEYTRPVAQTPAGSLSLAGFVDTARAWHRLNLSNPSPVYVDLGVGVRVHAPRFGGTVRIDLAHGLRDGGTALSASWGGQWPQ